MNATAARPQNPRRLAYTSQKLAARRRQGARWNAAQKAVADTLAERFIGERQAWRRWMADPAE